MRDIGYYIKKVRELPPGVAMKKALMKLVTIAACKLEKARARLSPAHISDEQLGEKLDRFSNFQ